MAANIRLATSVDAAAVLKIYGPFCEESPITFETKRPTITEMEGRILDITERFPWLICENGADVVGYAYASSHRERAAYRWAVDVAVYIAGSCRGQGIGTALYTALFQVLRAQGFYKAYAGITLPNPASIQLHRRLGFEHVGVYKQVGFKAGAWHDVSWWDLTLQPPGLEPEEPRRIGEVIHRPDFLSAINGARALL
ncbi:MAG: N-acetyltransferase [Verrucomicrobia bacterium]|nr:N-acetyltransferase [Verrucomicrobiota bacterium]